LNFRLLLLTIFVLLIGACKPKPKRVEVAIPKAEDPTMCYDIDDQSMLLDKSGMIFITGGTFEMGGDNDQARTDEFPKVPTKVNDFWMDKTEVTNADFAKFVAATGYKTVAERTIDVGELMAQLPPGTPPPPPEALAPMSLVFSPPNQQVPNNPAYWWQMIQGANWRHPSFLV